MTQISKAEFDALPESLKAEFKADGDNYILVKEDTEGLKKSKAEILEEKKRIQAEFDAAKKRLEEIDAKQSEAEEAKMKAAGEFAELEKKLRDRINEIETNYSAEKTELLTKFNRERLSNELVARGVDAKKVKYALSDLEAEVDLLGSADGVWKLKNGIGDAKEFDTRVAALKEDSPFLFVSSNASGSGASGSQGTGAGGKTISRAQFNQLPPSEQMTFAKGGGQITE